MPNYDPKAEKAAAKKKKALAKKLSAIKAVNTGGKLTFAKIQSLARKTNSWVVNYSVIINNNNNNISR
jgi:plasmid maintenance system killer protein